MDFFIFNFFFPQGKALPCRISKSMAGSPRCRTWSVEFPVRWVHTDMDHNIPPRKLRDKAEFIIGFFWLWFPSLQNEERRINFYFFGVVLCTVGFVSKKGQPGLSQLRRGSSILPFLSLLISIPKYFPHFWEKLWMNWKLWRPLWWGRG